MYHKSANLTFCGDDKIFVDTKSSRERQKAYKGRQKAYKGRKKAFKGRKNSIRRRGPCADKGETLQAPGIPRIYGASSGSLPGPKPAFLIGVQPERCVQRATEGALAVHGLFPNYVLICNLQGEQYKIVLLRN